MLSKTVQPIKIFFLACLTLVLFCLFIWFSAAISILLMNLAQHIDGTVGTFLVDKGTGRMMRRIMLILAAIIIILTLKKFGWRGWKDCGWIQDKDDIGHYRRRVQFGWGAALGFISLGGIALWTIFTGLHQLKPLKEHYPAIIGNIIFFCLSGISVALVEETICRGILFRVFARRWRAWPAAIIISILFAAAHFFGPGDAAFQGPSFINIVFNVSIATVKSIIPPPDSLIRFLNLALLGIVLCVFVMRTKTIWMSVGAHAAWVFIIKLHSYFTDLNLAAVQSIWLGKRNDFMDSRAAAFIFLALILLTLFWKKKAGRTVKIGGEFWHIMPSGTAQLDNFLKAGEDLFSDGKILKAYPGCRVTAKDGLVLKQYSLKDIAGRAGQLASAKPPGEAGPCLPRHRRGPAAFWPHRPTTGGSACGWLCGPTFLKPIGANIRFAFRPLRTRRAFLLAEALIGHGVPTPPVLAWSASRRFGILMSETMIVSEVKNAEPLTDWLATHSAWQARNVQDSAMRLKVMEAYGNLMAAFHSHGYSNRDLKHENVMCSKTDPAFLQVVDLDGVRKHLFISRRRADRDLARIGKSLASLGWTNAREIAAFFEAYNRHVPLCLHRCAFPGQ